MSASLSRPARLAAASLVACALVFACVVDAPPEPSPRATPLAVVFVAPYDGQVDVPSSTRVWIRASASFTSEEASTRFRLLTESGEAIGADLALSSDSHAVVLSPAQPLQPGHSYEVVFRRPSEAGGDLVVSRFSTRAAGSRSRDGFKVVKVLPVDDPTLSVWPFTTFRILLSEPVRADTAVAAGASGSTPTVRLIRVATGEAVSTEILVRGSTLSLDPSADLEPGESYRVELTEGLLDLSGEALSSASVEFTVRPLAPMRQVTLALAEPPSSDGGSPGAQLDVKALNTLELRSSLVGRNTLALEGVLRTELPDPAQHGARLPMVIRKGQFLQVRGPDNGGLAIRLGGQIGTNLNSGPLTLTIVTDGTGEISDNPYQVKGAGSRPLVRMMMDVVLTAQDPTVNTMLTQDLLTLQLVGALFVENGQLGVELVGSVELDILGMDIGASFVSLSAWSSDTATPAAPSALSVRMISPANGELEVDLDRPIQVVFSLPPDSSVRGRVWLERAPGDKVQGSADDVPAWLETQGALVLVRPREYLATGVPYVVRVSPGIRSASGEALSSALSAQFETRRMLPVAPRPTILSSLRPGAPCAFYDGGIDRQCSPTFVPLEPFTLAGDLPIEAYFTQPVRAATLSVGKTVEVFDADGGTPVPGRVLTGVDWFRFIPDEPWRQGQQYLLRVGGSGAGGCGQSAICDLDGGQVNTDLLLDVLEAEGGPPIELAFTGAAAAGHDPVALRLVPSSDLNSNGALDLPDAGGELRRFENSVALRGTDGGVADRTYLSGTLLARVEPYDSARAAMPVSIEVGSWIFGTSAKVFGITTDRMVMRPAGTLSGTLTAAAPSDPDQRPIMAVPMLTYMDSVNDTVEEALQREPLQLDLSGRLSFTADGRMVAEMTNTNAAQLLMADGNLKVFIWPGDVQVRVSSGVLGR